MPSLEAAPNATPPPGAAPVAAAVSAASPGIPAYEGKDEAEKLTKALLDYYDRGGADVPIATSLEALVKAGYLKSVPVPPPGKKYVVTTKYPFQVRLENK
jgi:hypothetical protein